MLKSFKVLKRFSLILTRCRPFSTKDDKFWDEYSKRKAQGGRVPALEGQEIFYNKTLHSWKYAKNHALTCEEVVDSLKELKAGTEAPFVIVDVREDIEFEIYKLPRKTKVTFILYRKGLKYL